MARLRGGLWVLVGIVLVVLGAGYCLSEAQYRFYAATTARRIVAGAGLGQSASITVVSYDLGEKRSASCSDPGTMAGFEAWLGEATGKRQHEPGGPTPPEQWLITLDDGREVRISWWDLAPTLEGDARLAITVLPGVLPGAQIDDVRIEDGLAGEQTDPRPDPRIMRALEKAGKLRHQ